MNTQVATKLASEQIEVEPLSKPVTDTVSEAKTLCPPFSMIAEYVRKTPPPRRPARALPIEYGGPQLTVDAIKKGIVPTKTRQDQIMG